MEASAYTPPIVARLGRRGGTLDTSRWSVFPPVLWLDAKTFFFSRQPDHPTLPLCGEQQQPPLTYPSSLAGLKTGSSHDTRPFSLRHRLLSNIPIPSSLPSTFLISYLLK